MARVPTMTLCWMTSDRFPTARNVWVLSEKIAPKATRTTNGPTAGVAMARPSETVPRLKDAATFGDMHYLRGAPTENFATALPRGTFRLTPAILDPEFRVL